MEYSKAIEILRRHNAWRRGAEIPMDEPQVIGEAIDAVVENACKEQPAEWSEEYREEDLRTRFAFYTYKNEDDDGTLYLSNVFVEEASRNKGLGTKILLAAEKVAEILGMISICLKVKQDSPANAWYRKNGYGYVAYEDGYDWLEKNLEYMKPIKHAEWSEKDENTLNDAITAVDLMLTDNYKESHPNLFKAFLTAKSWLKSLPERLNLQPKQDWSEEDKRCFDEAIEALESLGFDGQASNLKSLRDYRKPQNTWKPSEEQKDLIPLINRICEAILFEWKDAADLARKVLIQIKEREEETNN